MTKTANLTERELQSLRNEGHDEAADEIDRLQATVAGLRKSASLRVQFHAAELADVTAERDMWKNTLAQRDRKLANARAIEIHSCHDGCTRAGCVAAGLREDAERYKYLRDVAWETGSLVFYAERYGPEDWDAHIDAELSRVAARKAAP